MLFLPIGMLAVVPVPSGSKCDFTVDPAGYSNGVGSSPNPKGWPGSSLDGIYQAKKRCENGGDLSPCTPPFDPTCDNLNNGLRAIPWSPNEVQS